MTPSIARVLGFLAFLFAAKFIAVPAPQDADKAPERAAELVWLDQLVGEYDAEVDFGGKKSKGTYSAKFGCGGQWLIDDFKGDVMGEAYVGHGLTGYDATKKKIVAVWVESSPSPMTQMEGTISTDKKSMILESQAVGPDMKPTKSQHTMTIVDKKSLHFAITSTGADGKESTMLKIVYTRK